MKTIKRRAFCKAAAAAVAGVLSPHAAAEALLPQAAQAVVGSAVPEDYYSFAFRSDHSETDLSHDFYYTDAFFENTALQYSHKLALATLGLVAASGNTYQSDALYWVEGEAGREDSIADAYQKLGFANAVYAGYQCSLNTPVDTAGCAFAQKTLVQDGQRTTIIAAMLRGVGYGAEWASNLHVGEGGGHYGFVTAAEHFFEDLQDYLKKAEAAAGTLGTIKLWLGGYSRGAAVANLTAARIRQQLPQIAQENTFVYTFAAPAALTAADRPDLQADYDNDHTADGGLKTDWDVSNIFNIISSGDIVARVMPEEWGYHRNGNDRFLPSTAYQNELDDLSIIESRMGGVPLRFDQLATKEDVDSVIAAALAFCKSAANYHEKYEAAFMDMLQCAFTLSEKEAAEGVILDDEAVMERLRSMKNIRKMSWTKVLRCVMTASAMSRPILEQVGAIVPLRAQQVVVPVLPGGLGCLAGVVLFGPWQGFLYNYVGICAGSLAAFAIARSCGRPLLYRMFPASLIEKYDRWSEEKGRFARWFALLIFLPVAPDDYLCFLAGTTGISWQKYTAILLLCKPFSIALYSLGLTVAARQLLGLWA